MAVQTSHVVGPYIIKMECDSVTGNLKYLGRALSGSTPDRAVWQIRAFLWDASNNPTDVDLLANGTEAYDMKWNDRATLTYS